MTTRYYAPKVWWIVYAIIPMFIGLALILILKEPVEWPAIILLTIFAIFVYTLIVTTKYAIRGNEIGICCFSRWKWYPIDKIESLKEKTSIISTPTALSPHRLSIKFSNPKILKSFTPLEISPKDMKGFIAQLLKINPDILH